VGFIFVFIRRIKDIGARIKKILSLEIQATSKATLIINPNEANFSPSKKDFKDAF
jgi:hypothetical protein